MIRAFKRELASRKNKYDKWADFEMGMTHYAKVLSSERDFIECIHDFQLHMVKHLKIEEQKIGRKIGQFIKKESNLLSLVNEFDRSCETFFKYLLPKEQQLEKIIPKDPRPLGGVYIPNAPAKQKNAITFNYTRVLDWILQLREMVRNLSQRDIPLHVHGTLNKDVVLGVDTVEQLKGVPYEFSRKGKRAFIKPFFNMQYDSQQVETAQKRIKDSRVLCTFGFSFGESDKSWVDFIVKWLNEDSNHHLVVFQHYSNKYNFVIENERLDAEEDERERLCRLLGISVLDFETQIHVPIKYHLFDLGFIKRRTSS